MSRVEYSKNDTCFSVIVMQLFNLKKEIILNYHFTISFDKLAEMMRLNRFESVFEHNQPCSRVMDLALTK